jgi:hypothetical protein
VEPQPQDSFTAIDQVEVEDPRPSEQKEGSVTVVDLTRAEAIEDSTRTTKRDEDWEVAAFECEEEGEITAGKTGKPPKKSLAKEEKYKPFRSKYSYSPKKTNPKQPTRTSTRLYKWHKWRT